MHSLEQAVESFLIQHRKPLLALVVSGNVTDNYMVELHTLASLAAMLQPRANLLRLHVSPRERARGSHVMSQVLEVEGAWFDFKGRHDCNEKWARLIETAARDHGENRFDRSSEAFLPQSIHPVMQGYVDRHFPVFLSAMEANALDGSTTAIIAQGNRPHRL